MVRSAGVDALPLRVGISTRALFDLEPEHAVFEAQGVGAYIRMVRDLEDTPMATGSGYEAVHRLLALNEPGEPERVQVVLLSRNGPEASLRAFAAIEAHGLNIATGSFTSGRSVAPFLKARDIDLFLSMDNEDVDAAASAGVAAARLAPRLPRRAARETNELRIALDGDAVMFSDESEEIFARNGLQTFLRHEVENARRPMASGPFGTVLRKLVALSAACRQPDDVKRIRIALVTARTAPAHARVIHTLRAWGAEIDEAHFVGAGDKAKILEAFGAHLFFDDQERHVSSASSVVPSGLVPRQQSSEVGATPISQPL